MEILQGFLLVLQRRLSETVVRTNGRMQICVGLHAWTHCTHAVVTGAWWCLPITLIGTAFDLSK